MELVSVFFKQSVPHYFENLPIPNSFKGWFRLSFKDWLTLVPLGVAFGGIGYMSYYTFCPKARSKGNIINPSIKKFNPICKDIVNIEDISQTLAVCRCWRSKKFPLCDGSHNRFNEETGDNVGPFVLKVA